MAGSEADDSGASRSPRKGGSESGLHLSVDTEEVL